MDRRSTTDLLTKILLHNIDGLYAQEVTIDACSDNIRRVDVMQFKPAGGIFICDIEKGIFTCYEIKSCIEDVYSGNGLNFIGEENYIVTTMQTYKKLLPDINSGKLQDYIKKNFEDSSTEFGIMVPVLKNIDLRCTDMVFKEYAEPTEFGGEYIDWKLYKIIPCGKRMCRRKKSVTELLFCMLRSKHSNYP